MKIGKRGWPLSIFGIFILVCLFLTGTKVFSRADTYLADIMYQRGNTSSGKIVLVELDEKTLEQFGATPAAWDREIYARVLNYLNQSDNCHPAVIGLDVLFSYDKNPQQDHALAVAAARFNNVVTAEKIAYETIFSIDGDSYQTGTIAVSEVLPYETLKSVTTQGVVNPVLDPDGLIRHIKLNYEGPDGSLLPSFPLAVAQKYRDTLLLPDENDLYLEYTFPGGGYSESIALLDIYNGEIPAEYFNGKIVLIGAYASALQDDYRTPIEHTENMYGVEIHANAVDMILKGAYHQEVSDMVQLLVLAVLLVTCAFIYNRTSLVWMVAAWLIFSFGSLYGCDRLYLAGYILHPLWLPVGASALFFTGLAMRFISEAAQRRRLREQFGKYVDPQVLDRIMKQGSGMELAGCKRNIAVLFVDICGFTSLSEYQEPEEVVKILNCFLGLMTDCIMQNHGTLDKFIGDCCMGIWNAPLPQEDAVMCAVKAGMDMIASSEELNKQLGINLGFAVGIHYGEAVVGNIGSAKRMDYTAIGDTVNTASRLESLKIPGQKREGHIYISQEVLDQLRGRITAEDLGTHPMKGKKDAMQIYSITGFQSEER